MLRFAFIAVLTSIGLSAANAGYEQPNYIDGCQSIDGRFVVTAELVQKSQTVHGPNKWKIHWRDTKTNKAHSFEPASLQGGQIYAQMFVAPDGETLAIWNHLTIWTKNKSNMHGPADLPHHEDTEVWKNREEFSRRILVYKKDGTLVKELGLLDLVRPEEWSSVGVFFNRVHWLDPYEKLSYRSTPRMQYALYRVSPDYTILEFQVTPPRGAQKKGPRMVRVSLTEGRILGAEERLTDANKIPVRPYVGPNEMGDHHPSVREGYLVSLDPVRTAGKFTVAPNPPPTLALVKDGFTKADTPAWLPSEKALVFTDLEQKKLFRVGADNEVTALREGLGRGRVGPDGLFYGSAGSKLVSWKPGEEPKAILDTAPGGKEISLNDLAIGPKHLFFTTLKDPEKGRVTVVDLAKKLATVAFDANDHPDLANPNGIAISPDGKWLYVAISNYKDRKKAGVYRFAVDEHGKLDLASGKKKWATAAAPDGLALSPDGELFCTDGGIIHIFTAEGRDRGSIKVPKESATNLTFGGPDGRTLYVTTNRALYSGRLNPPPAKTDDR